MKVIKSRLPSGKKLLFVLTQGNGDELLYGDIAKKYFAHISTHGFNEHHLLRVCGISPGNNVLDNKSIVTKADALADLLMK